MSRRAETTVEVIIRLSPEAAKIGISAARAAIADCGLASDIQIFPLHPATADPELSQYFVSRIVSSAADDFIRRLLKSESVEGAYTKPGGEPPERSM